MMEDRLNMFRTVALVLYLLKFYFLLPDILVLVYEINVIDSYGFWKHFVDNKNYVV
jgi:hypothetical protein